MSEAISGVHLLFGFFLELGFLVVDIVHRLGASRRENRAMLL
jgi:hypothetical protein